MNTLAIAARIWKMVATQAKICRYLQQGLDVWAFDMLDLDVSIEGNLTAAG